MTSEESMSDSESRLLSAIGIYRAGVRLRTFPEMKLPPPTFVPPPSHPIFTTRLPEVTVMVSGMEILRNPERRREPRTKADLALTVWGVDANGERFLQKVYARDISLSGALLFGLDTKLRSGDVVGILYAGRKSRFRVVWVGHSGPPRKVQAAVHRFASDECPWKDLLTEESAAATAIAGLPVR
jgi:hypothetical protein